MVASVILYLPCRTLGSLACIIREVAEEWFWGGEIVAKMLAAA